MANRNGMGPQKRGPRTGRGLGNCPEPVVKTVRKRKLDGTGPEGKGPRTGRGLGNCPEPKDSK